MSKKQDNKAVAPINNNNVVDNSTKENNMSESNRIAELEARLAEKEEVIETLKKKVTKTEAVYRYKFSLNEEMIAEFGPYKGQKFIIVKAIRQHKKETGSDYITGQELAQKMQEVSELIFDAPFYKIDENGKSVGQYTQSPEKVLNYYKSGGEEVTMPGLVVESI